MRPPVATMVNMAYSSQKPGVLTVSIGVKSRPDCYDVSGSGNETVVLIHEVGGCIVSVAPPDRGGAARRPAPGPAHPAPPASGWAIFAVMPVRTGRGGLGAAERAFALPTLCGPRARRTRPRLG